MSNITNMYQEFLHYHWTQTALMTFRKQSAFLFRWKHCQKFTWYMHRCARIFCRNTNTFTHQWNKWAPFNVLITDNLIFMAQGTLLVEHFLYHHPSSTSSLSHGNILPNTLLSYVLKICSFSGVKHYVTLIKQAVDVELLNTPPTTIKTFLTHPK
jgi:hypothetical protein